MRRRVGSRLAVVIGALVVALGAPVSVTAGSLVAGERCAGAATGPTVAVVVDFGDVSSQGAPPGGVVSQCVSWSTGFTGLDALKSAGLTFRAQGAGQVCAINGYPADGCGQQTGERKYLYWAYWKAPAGDDSWDYSTTGAGTRIRSGGAEGWRFVEGAGSPNDPEPRGAADHDATCGPTTDSDSPAAPEAGVPEANDPASPTSSVVTGPDASAADAAADDPAAPSGAAPSTATTATNAATPNVALAVATPASTGSNAGNILGVVIVAAVIVGLAAAAFFRSRRTGTG